MKQHTLFEAEETANETIFPVDPHVEESDMDRLSGQNATVRDLLYTAGMIKNTVAITHYKILRLAARIKDLRSAGMNITTKKLPSGDTLYLWDDYTEGRRAI